jgi:uncharacterized protein
VRIFSFMFGALISMFPPCSMGFGEDPKPSSPLVIGESFAIDSKALNESRRINVYLPPGYSDSSDLQLPVLYMPDGGLAEDFLHLAGLVHVSVGNGTMRPYILVGIENTVRHRDLAGPTEVEEEGKISPQAGGSDNFRRFLREELKPEIAKRYRITKESAIVGESLAGLFVVETFLVEPELFDTYIAIDPSVWWNNQRLVKSAARQLKEGRQSKRTFFLASSEEKENELLIRQFVEALEKAGDTSTKIILEPMPEDPAALKAFRAVLAPIGK